MTSFAKNQFETYTISSDTPQAIARFSEYFHQCIKSILPRNIENIIVLCIGTDRSTGDCLGPLIGHKLHRHQNKYTNIHILGTLESPVHAKNLEEYIEKIKREFPSPFIIAVDACLGKFDRVGYINISPGPLKPGAGVNKSLPPIGDMHITGIVNIGGFMEYIVLQNTRLNLVMKMADVISQSLHRNFLLFDGFFTSKEEVFERRIGKDG
ncbi:spore protease YyaC [Irregularibacter muris]|uniref:Spore protease YyaC n=1 Tax=Irregularibacter muris TaxID=1796619 RepID=A0AAE3HHK3_9FIRM|nr:spore protease YyaC [Irregularibacter muris]MCR1899263.1 spore protease YyaC [Irregularibacter muris]